MLPASSQSPDSSTVPSSPLGGPLLSSAARTVNQKSSFLADPLDHVVSQSRCMFVPLSKNLTWVSLPPRSWLSPTCIGMWRSSISQQRLCSPLGISPRIRASDWVGRVQFAQSLLYECLSLHVVIHTTPICKLLRELFA